MTSTLIPLEEVDCVRLLSVTRLGRIAVIDDGHPLIFPINFRLIDHHGRPAIAIRTRPDNIIDHLGAPALSIQIDSAGDDEGWSVLVRGTLQDMEPDDHLDPHPGADDQREAWRLIIPSAITGRRLIADAQRWTFNPDAYL